MTRHIFGALILILTATVAAAQSYKIKPGDVLQIEVLEDSSLNRNTLVLPDGSINFPLVGSISAGGGTLGAVQSAIVSALEPNFAAPPNVFVSIASLTKPAAAASSNVDVYIMGEVNKPGELSVNSGSSLLQVLAQAGGFTKFAATKRIQVRRINKKTGTAQTYSFDYKAIESGMSDGQILILRQGDIIIVPERRLFE